MSQSNSFAFLWRIHCKKKKSHRLVLVTRTRDWISVLPQSNSTKRGWGKVAQSRYNYRDSLHGVFMLIYNASYSCLYPRCLFSPSPLPLCPLCSHPKWPVVKVSWSPVNEEVDLLVRHQCAGGGGGGWNLQKPASKYSHEVCIPKIRKRGKRERRRMGQKRMVKKERERKREERKRLKMFERNRAIFIKQIKERQAGGTQPERQGER